MMREPLLIAAAAGLMFCNAAGADSTFGAKPLRGLQYGDVLFHYYQDQDFDALTELMMARSLDQPQANDVDGELLLAGLLLSFGQTRDAITGFEHALQTEVRRDKRNQAWLSLARALHQTRANSEALAALQHIDAPLESDSKSDLEADRQMLTAELLIDLGRFDEAASTLRRWKGARDWMPYAQYNLGVALLRAGRKDEGEKQLDAVDRFDLRAEEQRALRDRANTALGYSHLQAKEWDAARNALRRVRLAGPSSNQALLGLGWAESGLENDRDALVPWMELASRDAADLAVQEALLAVPYAMARADAPTAAAEQYQVAVNRFQQQAQKLDALSAAVKQNSFVDRLLDASDAQGDLKADASKPVAPLAQLPEAPEYQALSKLIASDEFQSGLHNARRLRFLKQHLAGWLPRVAALKAAAPNADWPAQSARLAKLSEACDRMLQRQRSALQDQALAEMQRTRKRLADYETEARFAQARVLDRSTTAPAAGKRP
ncbi:tetratricopeptide repeat protein [Hydrocarboniphaga sp.]|uniref:tetratricopeptide repeat protein n=1 Tax=Hydrocarboniphaga sp. TaxID=2033016 RepID=UPI003D0DCBB5